MKTTTQTNQSPEKFASPMDKFEKFVQQYEGNHYDQLPKFLKRRVDALKKLQLEHIKIQHQYNKRLQELEMEFEKMHKPLYEKRAQIINGLYEPNDEECQLPAIVAQNEFNGDQENKAEGEKDEFDFTDTEVAELQGKVKGLPGFWLGCLNSTFNISDSIEDHDRAALKHLKDVRLSYDQQEDTLSYKLEFIFDENPFFSNKVLTKTYYLKSKPDEKNPFSYEGFEVYKSEGCDIRWKENKDITVKIVDVKQRNKKTGECRSRKKEVEQDSFFYFFKPPQMPEGGEEEVDDELGGVMAVDFELGELIRQSLIPKAILYYSGYMVDEDDDADDEDEEIDDSEAFDYDDSDEEDEDESDSNDSLHNKKDD